MNPPTNLLGPRINIVCIIRYCAGKSYSVIYCPSDPFSISGNAYHI